MAEKRRIKWTSLFLALVCVVSIVGCQSQPDPISSEEPSSVTADLPESSQEPASSQVEEPVSSEPSVVEPKPSVAESKPQPEVSSQPEPSSVQEAPSSVAESPSSQDIPSELAGLPTIPFEVGYQERFGRVRELDYQNRSHATLIRSKEELKQKYTDAVLEGTERFFQQCDDAYFKENAMVHIELIHGGLSKRLIKVNPVVRSGDQLIVNLYYDPLPEGTYLDEMTTLSTEDIFLSIKQTDVQGITQVVCNSSKPEWAEWK